MASSISPEESFRYQGDSKKFTKEETVESIHCIFNARSIAVVGASRDSTKYGYMTVDCLINGGYDGSIYPVSAAE